MYDRQRMLRLINSNEILTNIYLRMEEPIDERLKFLYNERVVNGVFGADYFKDFQETQVIIIQESPLELEIKRLIEKYSWSEFIEALISYADKKVKRNNKVGLKSIGSEWARIKDKFGTIKKTLT